MMKEYDHKKIEKKWQTTWDKKGIYKANDKSKSKKFYGLIEFPYPSGDGLHVGHVRSNTAMDIISRKRRMEGYNVLYPIGWDAFGLPTENYAIKTGISPLIVTKKNTDTFRRQLKSIGFSFDWSREVNTTDPKYYKWTQWIFLQLLKKDLAYKAKITVNWCPKDKTGLANEEVVDGCCERCGTPVEKKEKDQWILRITKYADRLDKDLDTVDYLEKIKIQQRNWIGRSEGAEIDFEVSKNYQKIKIFTTRPDTIYGCTFVVLAPEHDLVEELWAQIENKDEVSMYIDSIKTKSDMDRMADSKDKTGVELQGIYAINPATKEKISIWIADFVLASYGTGAVFADAHDKRDFDFAKKYGIPLRTTIKPVDMEDDISIRSFETCFDGKGILYNSGEFSGLTSDQAIPKIANKFGKLVTKYKLRDWVFSRQRYWGEPIPVVHCATCGIVPVPEKELPLKLPKVAKYQPTDTGESPLAVVDKWVNTKCPKCKGKAKRETDTMPNWAGSSWYFLRYIDPKNSKALADKKKLKKMMPVDWYNGGMEHTTLHLLYSRFWNKFLYDIGVVPYSEPYKKRTSHGMILAKGGEKMSKSKGNVINPDDIVKVYGADTLRLYEMFMGPFDQAIAWSEEAIVGPRRFLERVWKLQDKVLVQKNLSRVGAPVERVKRADFTVPKLDNLLHKTIQKVAEDIEEMHFNTAISSMMILVSEIEKAESITVKDFKMFLQILAPFAPHVAEELWALSGEKKSIHISKWPKADPKKMKDDEVKIAVQINGKVRAELMVSPDITEEEIKSLAIGDESVSKYLVGQEIKRFIYVKGRLVSIVI